jgi:hypothetical protein
VVADPSLPAYDAAAAALLTERVLAFLDMVGPIARRACVRSKRDVKSASGAVDLLVAWVSVPDRGLHASHQRYEHVRRQRRDAIVRYVDLGTHRGFTSDLVLDNAALVLVYPQLARRVTQLSHVSERRR